MRLSVDPWEQSYPFVPKSNAKLVEGHFWGMDLVGGGWACGRVLGVELYRGLRHGSRVTILAGLLDWSSTGPPTEESIAGCVDYRFYGSFHVKAISSFGWTIDGWCDLGGTDFPERLERSHGVTKVYRGGTCVREASNREVHSMEFYGGYSYPTFFLQANDIFGSAPRAEVVAEMFRRDPRLDPGTDG